MQSTLHREGLKFARLLMVLSSISPIFILWGIRGNKLIPDRYFLAGCAAFVLIPNGFLWLRLYTAKKMSDRRELVVGKAEDHRDHLLVYLFTMLLPLYPIDLANWRDFSAILAALGFVIFLFWHLNLHYMNIFFAVFGYRVFTVSPPTTDNPIGRSDCYAVITRRSALGSGERIVAYRLSNTVYFEVEK
jgi:hypothetical protein